MKTAENVLLPTSKAGPALPAVLSSKGEGSCALCGLGLVKLEAAAGRRCTCETAKGQCAVGSLYDVSQIDFIVCTEGTCNLPVAGHEAALSRAVQQDVCIILGTASGIICSPR